MYQRLTQSQASTDNQDRTLAFRRSSDQVGETGAKEQWQLRPTCAGIDGAQGPVEAGLGRGAIQGGFSEELCWTVGSQVGERLHT